jgi:hypothetical protein
LGIHLTSANKLLLSPTTNVAYINSDTKIIKTTDAGASWNYLTVPTGITSIQDLAIDNSNGDLYLSACDFFKPTDGGFSWSKIYNYAVPPYNGIRNLFMHPSNFSLIYTIFGTKILAYNNQGKSWQDISSQIPNQVSTVDNIFVSPSDKIFISTDQGCFEGIPTLTSVRDGLEGNIIQYYSLENNYPNPFNPLTTIHYGIPARSSVRLVIYKVLGQVVKELVNGEQKEGFQSIVWYPNVSSGMYFYKLEAVSTENPSKRFVETRCCC